MTDQTQDSAITQTVALLEHYGFELKGNSAEELMTQWLEQYQAVWIRLAVIEALYLGRYKAISVAQILKCWDRRGNPYFHFNHDFERLICRKLPRFLGNLAEASPIMEEDYRLFSSNPRFSEVKPQPKQFYDSIEFSVALEDSNFAGSSEKTEPSIDESDILSLQPVLTTETATDLSTDGEKSLEEVKHIPLQIQESRLETVYVDRAEKKELEEEAISNRANKDRENSDFKTIEPENQSEIGDSTGPIHQFTPSPDLSQSFSKLKAVVEKVISNK